MSNKSFLFIIFTTLFFVSFLLASDKAKEKSSSKDSSSAKSHFTGTVSKVKENEIVVRVGDATKNYSFDNSTVFTRGDKPSDASSLKKGDEIIGTVIKNKVVEINGTKRIEGIVELIDAKGKTLKVRVGDRLAEFPFSVFRIFRMDGKQASVLDMKVGDSVFINVNQGFSKTSSSKKQTAAKQ